MVARRRLPSATYHSPTEEPWTRDIFADQMIAVHANEHAPADIARHVAEKQLSRAPFFVMNVPAVLGAVEQWQANMKRFQPFYSLKCNADPVLAQLLAETRGMGFEVCNQRELEVALELVDPSNIIYSHRVWTAKNMRMAGAARVGTIIISSEKELRDACRFAPEARILLSVSIPGHQKDDEEMSMNRQDDVSALLKTADDYLANFAGFSFNIDNTDTNGYFSAMEEVEKLWQLAVQNRLHPDTISVGGDFSYPKTKNGHFHEVVRDLHDAVDSYFPQAKYPHLQLVASPGRFFATAAFSLCTNVIARREVELNECNTTPFFVYQTNEGFDGAFGCVYEDQTPDFKPLHEKEHPDSLGVLFGPVLESGTIPQQVFRTRQLAVGDWLYWEDMGAFTMSVDDACLTHPVYYFSGKDNWELINKRRNSFADLETSSDIGSDAASDVITDDEDDCLMAFDNLFN